MSPERFVKEGSERTLFMRLSVNLSFFLYAQGRGFADLAPFVRAIVLAEYSVNPSTVIVITRR